MANTIAKFRTSLADVSGLLLSSFGRDFARGTLQFETAYGTFTSENFGHDEVTQQRLLECEAKSRVLQLKAKFKAAQKPGAFPSPTHESGTAIISPIREPQWILVRQGKLLLVPTADEGRLRRCELLLNPNYRHLQVGDAVRIVGFRTLKWASTAEFQRFDGIIEVRTVGGAFRMTEADDQSKKLLRALCRRAEKRRMHDKHPDPFVKERRRREMTSDEVDQHRKTVQNEFIDKYPAVLVLGRTGRYDCPWRFVSQQELQTFLDQRSGRESSVSSRR